MSLLAIVVAFIAPSSTIAEPLDVSPIHLAPPGTGLSISMSDAATWRLSPAGNAVAQAITVIEPLALLADPGPKGQDASSYTSAIADARTAWGKIADKINADPLDAFDRLLGSRVLFTMPDPATPGAWALATEIQTRDAKALIAAFEAAPRRKIDRAPVLAVEDGRFFIALVRSPWQEGRAVMVLSPKQADDHLEAVVTSLNEFQDDPAMFPVGNDAHITLRFDPTNNQDKPLPQPTIEAAAMFAGDICTIDVLAPAETLGLTLGAQPAIDPALFQEFASEAFVASAGSVSAVSMIPESLDAVLPQRFIQVARAVAPGPTMLAMLPPESESLGMKLLIAASADADPARAAAADDALARVVNQSSFRGFRPSAVRVAPITRSPLVESIVPLVKGEPHIAWTFRTPRDLKANPKAHTSAQPGTATSNSWWIATVGAKPKDHANPRLDQAANQCQAAPHTAAPVLSAGLIRPSKALHAIELITAIPQPFLEPLNTIAEIRWTTDYIANRARLQATIQAAVKAANPEPKPDPDQGP